MTTLCKKLFGWFKKNKKNKVRFYSLEPAVVDIFPIVASSSIKRNFVLQEQIGDKPETLSSKNCPGIRKLVSSGWIVPAPADFIIETTGDGVSLNWAEPFRFHKAINGNAAYVSTHTRSQTEPLLDDPNTTLKTVVKLETPWRVEADDDLVLLQIPVAYNNESRFQAATGIFDTTYGHVLNIQIFWKVMEGKTLVKAGTPLCQLIPIPRKHLSISNYDVTIEKCNNDDLEKERAFNYAANCVFLTTDTLANRLTRSMAILKNFKKEKL